MQKNITLLALLVAVFAATGFLKPDVFLSGYNIKSMLQWTSLFGVLSIGAAFVIITGGIDLSMGSVAALTGCLLPIFVVRWELPAPLGFILAMGVALFIGWLHGVLVTRVRLQPFVVTLCGLLIYRGLARFITSDSTQGFGNSTGLLKTIVAGFIPLGGSYSIPYPVFILLGLATCAAVLLNRTVFGRYLFALGRNEQAARYSGIDTSKFIVAAYVISAGCAGLAGMLFAIDINSVQPASFADGYELYAIAACVLGGCSLRGGEGSVFGLVVGTALMQVLTKSITMLGVQDTLEKTTIGIVILVGVVADEAVKRFQSARQRAATSKPAAVPADAASPSTAENARSEIDSSQTPAGKS